MLTSVLSRDRVAAGCIAPVDWRWDFCLQQSLPLVIVMCYFWKVAWFELGIRLKLNGRSARILKQIGACSFASRKSKGIPGSGDDVGSSNAMGETQFLEKEGRMLRNSAISKTLSLVNILYLPMSRYATSVFYCIQLAPGQTFLKPFPNIPCYTFQYYVFLCLGSVATLLCTPRGCIQPAPLSSKCCPPLLPVQRLQIAAGVSVHSILWLQTWSAFPCLSESCCGKWTVTMRTPIRNTCSRLGGFTARAKRRSSTTAGWRSYAERRLC